MSGGGAFDPEAIDGTTITFRGITLELDAQALSSDSSGDYDALLTGYSFEFGSTADTFAISRTSSNTSTAQLSGGTITDTAAYNAAFPDSG